ncbi:hypothetical protein IQ259_24390 [Fortiea sp. LEGE XX443]|uniref:hypothetical protein n=1 Tax=Fortiea sp. LEGE XX443 TaxID=1828611 RepID=UPI0018816FEF|nr:hypothetical protein [Fortiea sp. LEGE XX443]MBE9008112.1 hypothetical protein [Fortiea sp. LEGE XX443]
MTNVAINELNTIGYDLFHDSESFLDQLTSQEMLSLEGGFFSASYGSGYFNSKFGSHNGYYGYGGYGSYGSGSGSGSVSGYGGYGFGHKSYH